jgi:hypothetical protein
VRELDEQSPSLPPSLLARAERARDLVALILQASGPDGTADDMRRLQGRLQWESAVPEGGWQHWSEDRVPQNEAEEQHKRQWQAGQVVVRGWVGHPAVAPEVEAARADLEELVEPLGMPNQLIVTLVTAHFLGGTSLFPDGSRMPSPFAGAPVELIESAERIQPLYMTRLSNLATRIAERGARLDPADKGNLLVVAQLALLPIDLTLSPAELVDMVNTWPPGSFDSEAAAIGHLSIDTSRHGRDDRFQRDLKAIAETEITRAGLPAIRHPYAGGGKRQTREDTQRLREALTALVEHYPTLTPSTLLSVISGEEHRALEELRIVLGWTADHVPDRRRLERNWPSSRQ